MAAFTGPIVRKDTAKGHYYKDADGRRVPGVTTIQDGGLPKPALINWAANSTAEYAINNWAELSELAPAARLKKLQGARYEEKDTAAKRGTEVHHYAEQLVQGHEVTIPDLLAGHVEAYVRFLDEWKVKPVLVEFSCASVKHGYAGSGDLIADLTMPEVDLRAGETNPVRWLLDIKTTRSGIFGEVALQLAGYRFADSLVDQNGNVGPVPLVDRCGAVWVRADGYALQEVEAGPEQHRTFLYVQQVAEFTKNSRDLVGPAMRPPTTSTYRLVQEQHP
jgi:hypothetical protein